MENKSQLTTRSTHQSEMIAAGLDLIEDAIREDEKGNFEKAIGEYGAGLECLKKQLKHEKRTTIRQLIKDRFDHLLRRAEHLKSLLAQFKSREAPTTTASSNQYQFAVKTWNKRAGDQLLSLAHTEKLSGRLDDFFGADEVKEHLKNHVILPSIFPRLFKGMIRRQNDILVHGPPGTGKTFLAHAIANETKSSLFMYSISEIKSAWDCGHKTLIADIFKKARNSARAVVLFQDIHELELILTDDQTSKSFTNQFFKEIGMLQRSRNCSVVVIGETNHPDKMDPLVQRLFSLQIRMPLPDVSERTQIFKQQLRTVPHKLSEPDFQRLARITEGCTAYYIRTAVDELSRQQVRFVYQATHFRPISSRAGPKFIPCAPSAPDAKKRTYEYFAANKLCHMVLAAPLLFSDIESVLQNKRDLTKNSEG